MNTILLLKDKNLQINIKELLRNNNRTIILAIADNLEEINKILKSKTIELAIIGVEFGIDCLKEDNCQKIFIGDDTSLCYDCLRNGALDFFTTDFDGLELINSIEKAYKINIDLEEISNNNSNNDFIYMKYAYKIRKIEFKKITHISSTHDYCHIHFVDGAVFDILMKIKMLEKFLPMNQFIRVSRSHLVNKAHINLIDKGAIIFGEFDQVPISQGFKEELNKFISKHYATRGVYVLGQGNDNNEEE